MHKIQMFFFLFNSKGWKKKVPIKCLLPLSGASEREEQEGIRFGGAGMQIS